MIERLKKILEYYNLSASSFADKIDVPRSSISHLLSGRNKPSLDFVIKVETAFEEVDLNWLVYGKGTFPANNFTKQENLVKNESTTLFDENAIFEQQGTKNINTRFSESDQITPKQTTNDPKNIIVLYNDGTFDSFTKR